MKVHNLKHPTDRAAFNDTRNFTFGYGRIIWAEATTLNNGDQLPAGWVLPGGRRTDDIEEVAATALWIDKQQRAEERRRAPRAALVTGIYPTL